MPVEEFSGGLAKRSCTGCTLALILCAFSSVASASSPEIDNGVNFLFQAQDPTGAFSLNRGDLSVRDTAEVVTTFNLLGMSNDPRAQAAASFLRIAPTRTADLRSRVIFALRSDPLIDSLTKPFLGDLTAVNGGFAFDVGYAQPTVLDTSLGLLALETEMRKAPVDLFAALNVLTAAQQANGGIGLQDELPDLITSSYALRAMGRYRDLFDLSPIIGPLQTFITTAQRPDGSFGDARTTALAALALIESGQESSSAVIAAIHALEGMQEPTGGFGGSDPEVTALALRVLRFSLPNLNLAAADVHFSTTEPSAGTAVSVTVTVRNTGAQAAPATVVKLLRGEPTTGTLIGTANAPALAAGASAQVSLSWNTTGLSGTQILSVVLDATNLVTESHEDDNVQRYVLTVHQHQPIDLAITQNDVVFTPERPLENQGTTLAATVHNLGDDPTGPFVVRFYDGDPSQGGALLSEVPVATVAAMGSTTVSAGPDSFLPPSHAITVVVNPTNSVTESRADNNIATKGLVIASPVDLVLTGSDIALNPASPVHTGASTQVAVTLVNTGSDTFPAARVRLFLGDPTQGATTIGDINYGDLPPNTPRLGTLAYTAGNTPGAYLLYAIANPDHSVNETNERNNIARVPLVITGGPNITAFPLNQLAPAGIGQGQGLDAQFLFGNTGDQNIPSADIRVFDGDPRTGGKRLGDVTVALPNANPPGQPYVRTVIYELVTVGLQPGLHTIYAQGDPDHLIPESDTSDNFATYQVSITPRPNPGIVASDVVLSPATPEQGQQVSLTATVREFNFNQTPTGAQPRVQIFLGDPSTGTLLLDGTAALIQHQVSSVTFNASFATTNLLGAQKIVVLVDPQRLVVDADRSNNRVDVPFTVNRLSRPDLKISRADLTTTPVAVGGESSAVVSATVHNLNASSPTGVHVLFYDGDPATGGPVFGDSVIDVPPNGQAVAQATLDTHGLLGDIGVWVRVDPNNLTNDIDRTNNDAALPIEVRHQASTAPTNLAASVTGQTVNLSWTPGTLTPQRGSFVFRDGLLLNSTTTDVARQGTATATSSLLGGRPPSNVNDGDPNTYWTARDATSKLSLALAHKEYVSQVKIVWGSTDNWTLEAWDGVQFNVVASGPAPGFFTTTTVNLNPPVKTRIFRVTADADIGEMNVFAVSATSATTFQDANRPAGDMSYTVTAVDTDGIETTPATAPVNIPFPAPPSGLLATANGNNITLTWTPTTSSTATGYLIRRDGKPLNSTTEVTPGATMVASTSQSPASSANDGNTSTTWIPQASDTAPYLEAQFSAKKLVQRVDLGFTARTEPAPNSRPVPRDFDIQTWDGTNYVTKLAVRDYANLAAGLARFDLPDLVTTDRVRVKFITFTQQVQISELDVYSPVPVAVSTTSFVDSGRRVGSYSYSVTSANSTAQEGSAATASAIVSSPLAPTNLVATPSGNNVALSWTPGPESNIAGVYLYRDGVITNAASSTTIESRGTAVVSNDYTAGVRLADGTDNTFTFINSTNGFTVDLTFPRAEMVKRIFLSVGIPNYSLQTWDGTQFVTQAQVINSHYNGIFATNDYTLPSPVRTTKIRVLVPPQNSGNVEFDEIFVYAPAPIAGSSYTDVNPPEGTHQYQVSDVSVLDDEGAQSNVATARTGTVERPSGLVATTSGSNVQLNWTANTEANVAGYRVYRDFQLISTGLVPKTAPSFLDTSLANGTYTYWVTAVDTANGETAPSNKVAVTVNNVTPLLPPTNLLVAQGPTQLQVTWTASSAANVSGYNLYKDHSPTHVNTSLIPRATASFVDNYLRGQPRYTYEITSVDTTGLESARSPAVVAIVARPSTPTNVVATTSGTTVTVSGSASTGIPNVGPYRFVRDGQYIGLRIPGSLSGNAVASSTLVGSGLDPGGAVDGQENTYWLSEEDSFPVTLTMGDGVNPQPVDRIRLRFPDIDHMAVDFDVDVLEWDGWHNLSQVRGNTQLEYILDIPGPPPIGTRLRMTAYASNSDAVAVTTFRPFQANEFTSDNLVDTDVPPGAHVYAVHSQNLAGVFSNFSSPVGPSVPDLDLSIGPKDIGFSQQSVNVGDTIAVSAIVHSAGTTAADTVVALYDGDPSAGGHLISSQPVHVAAGFTAQIVAPYTIASGVLNIYAVIDPASTLVERTRVNNQTFRGLPFDLPYRSMAYSPGGLFVSVYSDNTHLIVRNSVGQNVASQTANRGQIVPFNVSADAYTISGDQKFATSWGGSGNLAATGYYVLDQENRTYSNEFYFMGAQANVGEERVVVFARDPNTVVTVSNASTSGFIAQQSLNAAGDHMVVTGTQFVPLHVVANNPVAVVNFADVGYPIAATNGKYTGTHFYGYIGRTTPVSAVSPTTDFNILSYQDNTTFTVRDLTTGQQFAQGTLNNNGIFTISDVGRTEAYWEVTASNTVGCTLRPYRINSGFGSYVEANALGDRGGTLIGTDFLDTVQGTNNDGPVTSGLAMAYYDNTILTVQMVGANPAIPSNQLKTSQYLLNAGEFLTYTGQTSLDPAISLNDNNQPPLVPCAGGFCPAIEYRLSSTRPVSSISGTLAGGGSGDGGPAPLLFGAANDPDLQVLASQIQLTPAQMGNGQQVTIHAQVSNAGARAAQSFSVEIFDNPPEQGGKLLHQEFVEQLVEGDQYFIDGNWIAESGLHQITVVADRLNAVVESDKTNNRAFVLAQTQADLSIAAADVAVAPSSVLTRQPATLTATVRNNGGRAATAPVALFAGDPSTGGRELTRQTVTLQPAGSTQLTFQVDTSTLAVGPQALYVKADPDATADDANRANNTASTSLQILAPTQPDLVVTSVSANPSSASTAQDVVVTVAVDNYGTPIPGTVAVQLYDGTPETGSRIGSTTTPVTGATNLTFTLSGPHSVGSHTLVAVIDPDSMVAESSETNNRAQTSVSITPATTTLAVATDRASYAPGASASVTTTLSGTPSSATLSLGIYDNTGGLVATLIASQAASDGALVTPFQIQGMLPGSYQASATLTQGTNVIARSAATFQVSGDAQLIAKLVTDHLTYAPDGTAQLIGTVSNAGTNDELDNLTLSFTVTDTASQVIGQATASVSVLPPGERTQRTVPIALAGHAPTTATATLRVMQGNTVLATSSTTFTITSDARVVGQVSASPTIVAPNQPVTVTRTLTAQGNADASGQIVTSVLDSTTGATLLSVTEPVTLPAGATAAGTASINTTGLAARPYIVAVDLISTGGVQLFRGVAGFEIAAPPSITISGVNNDQCVASTVTPVISATAQFTYTLTATLDGQPFTSGTPVTSEGQHTLTASATDALGNSATRTVTFTVDEHAPTISISGVTDQQVGATPVTPIFTVTDTNLTSSSATLDGAAFVSGTTVSDDGVHTLQVSATDCAGNQSSRTVTFTIDSTPPAIVITGVADASCNMTVTPVYTVTDATAVQVTATLDGVDFVSGTPVTTEGSHSLVVSAVDAAGNTSTASRTFIVDTTPPAVVVAGGTDGQIANAPVTPSVTITDANLTSSSVTLNGNPFTSGTTVSADGDYTLVAQATDCAGASTSVTLHFSIDQSAPVITIAGVGQCSSSAVTPTISVTDAHLASTTITLDGSPYTSGTAVGTEGTHTLVVSATDTAGNQSSQTATFIVDHTPPAVAVGGVVDGSYVNVDVFPTVTISDANLTSSAVTLDGAAFTNGSRVSAEGPHVLDAHATDCAGNSSTAHVTFTIDKTAPVISVAGIASGACVGATVTPTFTVSDASPTTVTATLDGSPFVSGTAVTQQGSHTLVVDATDAAGNHSSNSRTFIVDTTAPSVSITGVTSGLITAQNVTPVVAISDANLTSSSITLDGSPFASGATVSAEGDHLLVASATDCAGHTTSSQVAFAIDRTAPVIAVSGVSTNECTAAATVTPVITITDAHPATQSITLDGVPFASGTPVSSSGSHVLAVSATDAAGNASSQTVTFIIDRQAPTIGIAGVTDGLMTKLNVTPTVTITDPNLTTSAIQLDGSPFVSGTLVSAEGDHVLTVSATDCAGNQASAHIAFTIDKTAPVVTINGVAASSCNTAGVTPTFSATDAHLATVSATLNGNAFVSGTPVTNDGSYTLLVTATDAAGNATTAQRTFIVDSAAPTVSITGVSNNLVTAANVTPTVTISDANLTSTSILLDGVPFTSGTTVTAEGDHLLVASATDCANRTTTQQVSFSIDRTAPVVTISGVSSHQCTANTLTPTITITDAHLASQTITLNGSPYVSGTPIIADGQYEIAVTAIDAAGNRTDRAVDFIIDTQAPVITVAGVTDGSYVKTSVTPTFTITDANLTAQSSLLDGSSFMSGTVVSTEATHALVIEATDCAGNHAARTTTFTIDKTPPVVTLSGVTDGQCTNVDPTISATYSDLHLATSSLTVDGLAFTSGTAVTTEGSHLAVASATDLATNSTTKQASFILDHTAPSVTVSGVTNGQITNQNVTPAFTVTDTNLTSQAATLDGSTFVSGTQVTTEADHTLVVSGTDCANQTTSKTVTFTIDKTAPVITVAGVIDGGSYNAPVVPTFSATDTHLLSVTATLDGPSFTSGTTVSGTGSHTLVVTAFDRANNQATTTVHFTIGSSSTGTVSGAQPGNARILIAIESTNPPAAQPTFLMNTLTNAGYTYTLLEGRANWLPAFRSDAYGIVILYRTMSFSQDDYKELNEAVAYGNGVIYIGENPNLDPMQEAWGAHMGGQLNSISSVSLSAPLGTGSVTASGKGANIIMDGGTILGTTISSGHTYPAATTNTIGRNRGVLIAWNPELSTSSALATMYLNALAMVQPTASDLVPGGAATVQYNVNAGNVTDPFLLSMTLDPALHVLWTNPSTTGTSWNFTLPVNQSALFTAVLSLPDSSGTYPVHTVLQRQASGGTQTLQTSDVTVSVPRSRAQLMADVQAELNALALTGSQVGLRTDALNHLNQVTTAANPTVQQALQAIPQILKAADDTRQITQFNVTTIRIDLARLLRAWETRTLQ